MGLREAGVLILIDNKKRLILTKRTKKVATHKGQISFPGGKYEEKDNDLLETAIREAEEEIGIPKRYIKIIGRLGYNYISPRGYIIYAFVGLIDSFRFKKNEEEVERIIRVPYSFFKRGYVSRHLYKTKTNRKVLLPVYIFGRHRIWGATAKITSVTVKHLRLRKLK